MVFRAITNGHGYVLLASALQLLLLQLLQHRAVVLYTHLYPRGAARGMAACGTAAAHQVTANRTKATNLKPRNK